MARHRNLWQMIGVLAAAAFLAPAAVGAAAPAMEINASTPPAPAPAGGFVHADGTLIRDGGNKPLRLCGVNLGGWLLWEGWIWDAGFESESSILQRLGSLVGPEAAAAFRTEIHARFITEKDIAHIARMGFNVVRAPINHTVLEDDARPFAYKESGWQVLDRLLDWCDKHRVYVVLDLHAAPGGQSKLFMADPDPAGALLWGSDANQARTVALWKAVAGRYRDRRIVAGYDLLNEPAPPDGQALARLYRQIIAAVREADPNHMIVIEGGNFARDFSMWGAAQAANQAYSFHMYTWFGDDREKWLGGFRSLARRENVPLWNGEFGENRCDMIRSTVALYDDPANLVSGWCFWTWKKTPNRQPCLLGIEEPAKWKALAAWLAKRWFAPQPTREDAARAITEFLDAVECDRNIEDPEMLKALR